MSVVMPLVGGRHHPLRQDPLGAVLSPLELVADDRHLRLEIFLPDEAVDHPVGFELDAELEVGGGRRHRLVIVGAVEPGGAVEAGPVLFEDFRDLGERGRSLEHHVLEEVGHSGLAVAFVSGTDEDGEIDGDLRLGWVREQQNPEAIVEFVFGDSLHRSDQLGAGRRGSRRRHQSSHHDRAGHEPESTSRAHEQNPEFRRLRPGQNAVGPEGE
jgi:hypothetical protein